MRTQWLFMLTTMLVLYGAANYYIGLCGWRLLVGIFPHSKAVVYWLLFVLLAISFFLGFLGTRFLPTVVGDTFAFIGSYWLAAIHYLLIALLIMALLKLADGWLGFLPAALKNLPPAAGLIIPLLVIGVLVYGSWNAANPQLRHYDIDIVAKQATDLQQLQVVMVSDIHLGKVVGRERLDDLINQINNLNPDLVLLVGDTIDGTLGPFVTQNMSEAFRKLESTYGTFAVLGNHEYIGVDTEEVLHHFREAEINVLRDSYHKVEDKFYLVGRDDLSAGKRQPLSTLMADLDSSLPIILMDHQPYRLEEGQAQGVDLQLSGHTHHGQFFPYNFVTKNHFEMDWGYLRKGDFQVLVSCGFGTWGPPIRLGNTPEILDITIRFQDL